MDEHRLVVVLQLLLPTIVGAYGPSAPVREAALAYLRVAVCGLPSVLVLLAGTGAVVLGRRRTRSS